MDKQSKGRVSSEEMRRVSWLFFYVNFLVLAQGLCARDAHTFFYPNTKAKWEGIFHKLSAIVSSGLSYKTRVTETFPLNLKSFSKLLI